MGVLGTSCCRNLYALSSHSSHHCMSSALDSILKHVQISQYIVLLRFGEKLRNPCLVNQIRSNCCK